MITAGRRITWRPTPTSAAFGRVCSGGTVTSRSSLAIARQASRQPSRSSSGVNARPSRRPIGTLPSVTRTLHFLHVPWPPQVESIAMPFHDAPSKTVVPAGTRTSPPSGAKCRRTRAGACSATGSSTAVTSGPVTAAAAAA